MMGGEVIHVHGCATSNFLDQLAGELFEGVGVVGPMEYLVVHDANLFTDGSNDGYRPAAVAWHVEASVFSY